MNAKTFAFLVPPFFAMTAACSTRGLLAPRATAQNQRREPASIAIPKAYNDRDLSEWATPLPGLDTRPGFYPEAEFEKVRVPKFYRTYRVYHPDHEPAGYWQWLQEQPPKPL